MSFKSFLKKQKENIKQKLREDAELREQVRVAAIEERKKQMIETAISKEKYKGEQERKAIRSKPVGSGLNFGKGLDGLIGKPVKYKKMPRIF